jgi:hypothetical protein
VLATDRLDALQIALGGDDHPAGADDGLGEHRGDAVRSERADLGVERVRVVGRHPRGLGHEGLRAVSLAVERDAGKARPVGVQAVVGPVAADDDALVGLALELPVAASQLGRGVDGV